MIAYFKINLSKSQIEILLALIYKENELDKSLSLREIAEITNLDYIGCLHRNKDWLIKNCILISNGNGFEIDFKSIADLLFDDSEFSIIYRFAMRHLEYGL